MLLFSCLTETVLYFKNDRNVSCTQYGVDNEEAEDIHTVDGYHAGGCENEQIVAKCYGFIQDDSEESETELTDSTKTMYLNRNTDFYGIEEFKADCEKSELRYEFIGLGDDDGLSLETALPLQIGVSTSGNLPYIPELQITWNGSIFPESHENHYS